jgi:hypothetical protein
MLNSLNIGVNWGSPSCTKCTKKDHCVVECQNAFNDTMDLRCYAWTLRGAMKCPERREPGGLLFYEQWVSN